MATKVTMEALSPTMEEGRLVKWLKKEGDKVASGDAVAEVETDKAIMELTARGDGVLLQTLATEGDSAPVGSLLAVIGSKDEDISSLVSVDAPGGGQKTAASGTGGNGAAARAPQPSGEGVEPDSAAQQMGDTRQAQRSAERAAPEGQPAQRVPSDPGAARRTRSSPLARRMAEESGLDIGRITGSGPGGRIIKRDVEVAQEHGAAAPAEGARVRATSEYEDLPLTQIRKTIARRLSESIGPIPTFYLTAGFDLERMAEMRTAMAELGDEYKVSFNDILMKAIATALAQHPECNAHWLGDRIRQFNRVHLGMAVATDDGLIVPVIFDADSKPIREIALESRALAKKARERKLRPEEYSGSTFSVSNLGMFGIEHFTAIINPPEAGIIAIGAIEEQPLRAGDAGDAGDAGRGRVTFRKRMSVTMSCDHRVIDGAVGARFLQTLRRMIENPLMLVY